MVGIPLTINCQLSLPMLSIFRNLGNGGAAAVDAEIREVADLGSVPDRELLFGILLAR